MANLFRCGSNVNSNLSGLKKTTITGLTATDTNQTITISDLDSNTNFMYVVTDWRINTSSVHVGDLYIDGKISNATYDDKLVSVDIANKKIVILNNHAKTIDVYHGVFK